MRGREMLGVFGVGAFAVVCCAGVPTVLAFVGGVTLVGLLGGGLLAMVFMGCAALIVARAGDATPGRFLNASGTHED
jgi:hypothetical protein